MRFPTCTGALGCYTVASGGVGRGARRVAVAAGPERRCDAVVSVEGTEQREEAAVCIEREHRPASGSAACKKCVPPTATPYNPYDNPQHVFKVVRRSSSLSI